MKARMIGVGLVAGLVATAVMSAQMTAVSSTEAIGVLPPRRLADVLLPHEPPSERRLAAVLIHAGIGATGGMLYRGIVARRGGGMLSGALFGMALWAVGYQVLVPALGVLPPAAHDSDARQKALIQAHIVYGAVLGVLS